jgi:hypothetical protein
MKPVQKYHTIASANTNLQTKLSYNPPSFGNTLMFPIRKRSVSKESGRKERQPNDMS